MITANNFIYTEKGLYSVLDFLSAFNLKVSVPKVMSFNEVDLCYEFREIDEIEEIDIYETYELKFVDI
jgi:hypothetical protein